MRVAALTLALLVAGVLPASAECTKEQVCGLMSTMSHFEILDQCPNAGPLLVECKNVSATTLEDLPEANFVDNGDGTVTDTVNKLLWIKKGILKKSKLKDALIAAETAEEAGRTGWRLPTLPELKTLVYKERVVNASGKKAWINPIFDDGRGHYYWTTTTCDQLSVITDRYQEKICQRGDGAAWLIHFNINAIVWFLVTEERPHIWLVQNLE